MTEPNAQTDPTQPHQPRPGEGVEWPVAPRPAAQPTAAGQPITYGQPPTYGQPIAYGQPARPAVYGQSAVPQLAYGQVYAQPPQAGRGQASPYAHPQGQPAPYGQPPYVPNVVINNIVQTTAVAGAGGRVKSVGVAFLLTFLFGPLGMFYSTVVGAIVMLVAGLVAVPLTSGIGEFVVWPASIIWGCVAASRANGSVRVNQTSLR